MQNLCMNATSIDDGRDPGLVSGLDREQVLATGKTLYGSVWSISAETGKTLWQHDQAAGAMSMVATGGGLVFAGDAAGHFTAYDDTRGEGLWEVELGSPISGYPVTYAVDGKQYVAVTTGGSLVANAARRVTPELTGESAPSQVFVFALP